MQAVGHSVMPIAGGIGLLRVAAMHYGKTFNREDSWSDYPTSCFWNHNEQFYFNTHSGKSSSVAKPLCATEPAPKPALIQAPTPELRNQHADVSCNGTIGTFSWLQDKIAASGTAGTPAAGNIVLDEDDCSADGLCQTQTTLASAVRYDRFWVLHTDGAHTKIEHTFYCWAGEFVDWQLACF